MKAKSNPKFQDKFLGKKGKNMSVKEKVEFLKKKGEKLKKS